MAGLFFVPALPIPLASKKPGVKKSYAGACYPNQKSGDKTTFLPPPESHKPMGAGIRNGVISLVN